MNTRICARRVNFGRTVEVEIGRLRGDEWMVARPVVFEKVADDGCEIEPALKLRHDEAQGLIDELWSAGFRPSEGTGSAGSLAATERHLADMKAITFGLLKGEF